MQEAPTSGINMLMNFRTLIEIAARSPLDPVLKLAKKLRVKLDVELNDSGIDLVWIERNNGQSGSASEVMNALCAFADEHSLPVRLLVLQNHPKLRRYYERFGFEGDPEDYVSPEDYDEFADYEETYMVRDPR